MLLLCEKRQLLLFLFQNVNMDVAAAGLLIASRGGTRPQTFEKRALTSFRLEPGPYESAHQLNCSLLSTTAMANGIESSQPNALLSNPTNFSGDWSLTRFKKRCTFHSSDLWSCRSSETLWLGYRIWLHEGRNVTKVLVNYFYRAKRGETEKQLVFVATVRDYETDTSCSYILLNRHKTAT